MVFLIITLMNGILKLLYGSRNRIESIYQLKQVLNMSCKKHSISGNKKFCYIYLCGGHVEDVLHLSDYQRKNTNKNRKTVTDLNQKL